MRLLVVEDEKKLCDMIAKSLHQSGYEVDVCNDGEEALDMIYAEMYDLIVLDLNLPGMGWRFFGNFVKKMKRQRY